MELELPGELRIRKTPPRALKSDCTGLSKGALGGREALEDSFQTCGGVAPQSFPLLRPGVLRTHPAARPKNKTNSRPEEAGFEWARDTAGLVGRLPVPEPQKLPGQSISGQHKACPTEQDAGYFVPASFPDSSGLFLPWIFLHFIARHPIAFLDLGIAALSGSPHCCPSC